MRSSRVRVARRSGGTKILYRDDAGTCVNQAASDPTLATSVQGGGGASRVIKHFSAYTVVVN